jgi:ferritin-like metal-binding protein YciE
MKLNTLRDLYVEQLRDLYSAETQLVDALPMMMESASHPELQQALRNHLAETQTQVERLERIFQSLDLKPGGETCQAMKGLIKEGNEIVGKRADHDVRDAGIIAVCQRVEHYEIAGYGTVATYAEMLGRTEDHDLLGQTLSEEKNADQILNGIALSVVNIDAMGT